VGASIRIRAATIEDCRAINAIYNFYVDTSPATFDTEHVSEARRVSWFEERAGLGLPVLVAERDGFGDIAGWCALGPWSPKRAYDTTRDESIYVADACRGQGVGKLLLREVLEQARQLNVHVVMAGVVGCQEVSLALHRSLGFVQSGINRHMGYKLGQWHDVASLQCELWRAGRE
jgi:phosphinothricin acetyltransferase